MPRRQRVNPTEEAKRYCSLQTDKHGTEVKFIDDTIGHGVFATTPFTKGEFILEYPGEKISIQEGDRREEAYDDDRGSFLFFFGNKFCIDATFAKRNGRMVNDEAPKKAACNSIIKAIVVNGEHRLCIFAKRDIHEGEEVRYDYGVQDLPWRVKESDEEKHAKVEDGLQLDNQLKQLEPAEDDYRNNCNQEKGLVPTEEAMESRNSKKHEISSKTKPESDSGSGLEANDLHLDSPDHPDPLTPIVLEEMITSIRSREKDHNQQIPAEEATESFRSQEEDNGTSGKLKPVTDSGIIREGNNLHPDSPDHLDQLAVPVLEDMINRIHSRETGHDPTGEAMKSCRNREKPEISSKTKPDSASVSGLEVNGFHLHSPNHPDQLAPTVVEEMMHSIQSRANIPAEEATESFRSREKDNGTSGKLKPVTDSGSIREGNNLHPDSPDHLDQLAVPVLEDMINRIHSQEEGHDPTGEAMKSCRNREKPEISSKTKPDSASVSGLEVDGLHLHSLNHPDQLAPTVVEEMMHSIRSRANIPAEEATESCRSQEKDNGTSGKLKPVTDSGSILEGNNLHHDSPDHLNQLAVTVLEDMIHGIHSQEEGHDPKGEAMKSCRNREKHEICSKTKPDSASVSGLEVDGLHLHSPDHPDPLAPTVVEEMMHSIRSRANFPAEEATESFRRPEKDNGTSGKLKPVTDSGSIREGNNLHPDSPDHLNQLAVTVLEDMIHGIHSQEEGHDPKGEAMKSCRNWEKPEISSKTKPDSASVSGLEVDSLHLHSPSWPNEPSDSSDASDDPDYKYSGTDSEESDESDDNISASEADTGCETEEVFNFNASEAPDSTTGYVRPKRPCPFCGIFQSKLSRHIQLKHGNVTEVKDATQAPKGDRLKKFSDFKKKGILNENKKQAKEDQPVYQQERVNRTAGKLIMCGTCNGFYHSRFLSRHKKGCVESSEPSVNVPLSLLDSLDSQSADGFVTSILAKMRDDDIANICRQDQAIKLVGMRLWMKHKRKADKKTEVRKSVMTGMRRLASIYKSFCHLHAEEHKLGPIQPMVKDQQSAADMFVRSNFKRLETAIIACTTREAAGGVDELKHGLKSGIYYLFKKSAKILKGSYLIDDEDVLADRVDKFIEIFEMNNDILFGDAAYATYKARNENLRKPEALPLEEDIEKVRKYVVSRMEAVTSDCYSVFDSHAFVELRDLAVCRLTLFNARRGGEPSRLQMKEWADAEAGVWINDKAVQRLDNPLDRYLADQLKVAYQTGKGNKHPVPVLIPKDVVAALKMLADAEIRKVAGIDSQNPYLFPSTGCSQFHVSGWHAVNRVCQKLELTRGDLLTATKNRHRVSTIYAAMEVPEGERQYFYSHMGHSKEMNQNVYQAPLALMEVIRVGKSLSKMDGVEDNARMMPDTSSPSTSPCNSSAVEDDAGGMPVTRSSPDTAAYSSSSSAGVEDKARMMPDTSSASTLPCTSSAGVSISDDEDIPLDRVMKALAADNGATSTENPLKRGCSSSMGCQSTKAKQVKKPARKYSQWTEEETKLVLRYFSKFIKGSGTTLPNQQDIRDFKEAHPSMTQDFQTIKSKVFNERSKNRKLEKQRLDELNM